MTSGIACWSGAMQAEHYHDAAAIKYLSVAVGTILLYDYLLTFGDEVQFLWGRERKGWGFYLFLFNRYCPILYEIWSRCVLDDFPGCESIVKIHGIFFLLFLLSGQVVMLARLHVVANHRRAVLFTLAAVVLAQLTIGLITTLSPCTPAAPKASMDTSTFQPCFFVMSGSMGYAYIGLSLLFDVSIFLGVAMAVYGPGRSFLVTSYLLRQVIQETSIYFGVMVCSHLAMALAQVLSQDSLKVGPTIAVMIMSPVVVSRMVLSLARSTTLNQNCRWELDHFTIDSMGSDLSLRLEIIWGHTDLSPEEPEGGEGP